MVKGYLSHTDIHCLCSVDRSERGTRTAVSMCGHHIRCTSSPRVPRTEVQAKKPTKYYSGYSLRSKRTLFARIRIEAFVMSPEGHESECFCLKESVHSNYAQRVLVSVVPSAL